MSKSRYLLTALVFLTPISTFAVGSSNSKSQGAAQVCRTSSGPTYLGPFDPAVHYEINSVVTSNGSSYVALQCSVGVQPATDAVSAQDWVLLAQAGAVGAQGPQGATGAQGIAGPMGPQGFPGLTGAPGAPGALGAQGAIGATGATGPQGAPGATGAAGPQGVIGPLGLQGTTGAIGPQGLTGPQGTPGSTGAIGSQGLIGPQGLAGAVGPAGPQGLIGPQGLRGATGAVGAIGPQGLIGATGAVGAIGPQGLIGATGLTGAAGPQGLIGPQGLMGATGAAGAIGPQGLIGATGVTGAVGPQGTPGAAGSQGLPGVAGAAGSVGAAGALGPMGPSGPTGPAGPQGPAGTAIYQPLAGKTYMVFGDSYSTAFGTQWQQMVDARTGMIMGLNRSQGGRQMGQIFTDYVASDLVTLNYSMLAADLAQHDFIVIYLSTNDMLDYVSQGVPVGSMTDPVAHGNLAQFGTYPAPDTVSFYSKAQFAIDTIQRLAPSKPILVIGALHIDRDPSLPKALLDVTTKNPYVDMVNTALQEVCNSRGVPFVNMAQLSGINKWNVEKADGSPMMLRDGLHPSDDLGYPRVAAVIARGAMSLYGY